MVDSFIDNCIARKDTLQLLQTITHSSMALDVLNARRMCWLTKQCSDDVAYYISKFRLDTNRLFLDIIFERESFRDVYEICQRIINTYRYRNIWDVYGMRYLLYRLHAGSYRFRSYCRDLLKGNDNLEERQFWTAFTTVSEGLKPVSFNQIEDWTIIDFTEYQVPKEYVEHDLLLNKQRQLLYA